MRLVKRERGGRGKRTKHSLGACCAIVVRLRQERGRWGGGCCCWCGLETSRDRRPLRAGAALPLRKAMAWFREHPRRKISTLFPGRIYLQPSIASSSIGGRYGLGGLEVWSKQGTICALGDSSEEARALVVIGGRIETCGRGSRYSRGGVHGKKRSFGYMDRACWVSICS